MSSGKVRVRTGTLFVGLLVCCLLSAALALSGSGRLSESVVQIVQQGFPKPRLIKRSQERILQEEYPEFVNLIELGQATAVAECQFQFFTHRWNCSFAESLPDEVLTRRGLLGGSREAAFVGAIQNAGLVYVVTLGCSSGHLAQCSCSIKNQGRLSAQGFVWGGCSDDLDPGIRFAQKFFDSGERAQFRNDHRIHNLMNLHNNLVGRNSLKQLMELQCRCHGVSGSCNFRTCWRRLPRFREVGNHLRDLYSSSLLLQDLPRVRRALRSGGGLKLQHQGLIHVAKSPDFCQANQALGILGTTNRTCGINQKSSQRCSFLCCGRGFRIREEVLEEKCRCKFHWCCEVQCDVCLRKLTYKICN